MRNDGAQRCAANDSRLQPTRNQRVRSSKSSVIPISSCPKPYNPQQKQTRRDEGVCQPINPAVLSVEVPSPKAPESSLAVNRDSRNEKQNGPNYTCSHAN